MTMSKLALPYTVRFTNEPPIISEEVMSDLPPSLARVPGRSKVLKRLGVGLSKQEAIPPIAGR